MIVGEQKPSLEALLEHHGVKGMHWGQHKADLPTHASYTPRMQSSDRQTYGKGGVKRINGRLHAGMTRKKALEAEQLRRAKIQGGVAAGLIVASLLASHSNISMNEAARFVGNRAEANRQAARLAEKTLAIASQSSGTPYVKAGLNGVYKITTMK